MANELLPTEVCVCPLYQGRNIRKMLLPGFRNVTSPWRVLGDASGLSEGGKEITLVAGKGYNLQFQQLI